MRLRTLALPLLLMGIIATTSPAQAIGTHKPIVLVHGPTPAVHGAFSLWLAGRNFGKDERVNISYTLSATRGHSQNGRVVARTNVRGEFATKWFHFKVSSQATTYTLNFVVRGAHGERVQSLTRGLVSSK